MEVIIYTTETCPYCKMTKDFLKENNTEYTEYDVTHDKEKAKEAVKKSGQMAIPIIDIDGKIIVGFDKEELKKALRIE